MTHDPWSERPDFADRDLAAIEDRTQELGRYLFDHLDEQQPTVLQRRWWDERLMAWAMQDEGLKVQLFRFVDVLPMLKTNEAVVGHLNEYLNEVRSHLPAAVRTALGIGRRTSLTRAAIARLARLSAMDLARRFIAGTNVNEVVEAAQRERREGRGFTLDILGEAVTSDSEAEHFFHAYVNLIESVAPEVNRWPLETTVDRSVLDQVPRMNLSIKLSALDSQFDAIDPDGALSRAGQRLRELLRVAKHHGAFINVDMESYEKKALTLRIFKEVLEEEEFRDIGDVGIVVQCYLRDAATDLQDLVEWVKRRGLPVWVRLVKGAYWDYETVHAKADSWPIPVYQSKWQSDASFERATRFVMEHHKFLRPALGTHNIRSIAHGLATAEHLGIAKNAFEIQMLYGMADSEKHALVARGHRLRIYMPYGELIPGMAYLVRRLLENTSNDSFLRAGFIEQVARDELLRNPHEAQHKSSCKKDEEAMTGSRMNAANQRQRFEATFRNQPPINFSDESNRSAMREALQTVMTELGRHYPLVVGDQQIETEEQLESIDPSFRTRIVGSVSLANKTNVDQAVIAAKQALAAWRNESVEKRADIIRRAAQLMRDQFFELSALEVYECGKGWREATNDVCEAIDFCEYYADCAIAIAQPNGADVPGEENRFEYLPRGVTAVIAPWNFPLAILTGMSVAAMATGNTVVLKPAEQSSVIAARFMEILRRAGLPTGVANFLPGKGEVVGAALVEHPDVALIVFTGSREVGLAINCRAAEVSATGIGHVKRVIAEMGGKNAIIVDSDADLDEAVLGTVKSAFGFQGQKCSACSRVIVLDDIYDAFLARLIEATRSLEVGPAEYPSTSVGPVIDQFALAKVHEYIVIGQREGREELAVDVAELAQQGFFVGPHIYADVAPNSRLAQEEIFGPILAVIHAKDLDAAFRIANGTDFALTGGFYSRSPANLERARREMIVGNLYLNRTITGAIVGRQPFGGFKMSGIGSKAGGPDYVLQFVVPRTVTENTMRRGFAPEA
ncbi:MAG: L-glutamate gamma-semialdehyde dehydrogenase [Planctomycetaceae bacterium]|nr:L-glutamate gamma-semialdehyde dehydrogenase [Planctomycetales bacterium]MCB9926716.1 L-glutamate gamma-semialdehyde dehydrogenase [Planctomycetaceae bacterium]